MQFQRSEGEKKYWGHDYGEFHLGNMALMTREAQDLMTEASWHEQAWRQRHAREEVKEPVLLLPGESATDKNPWADPYAPFGPGRDVLGQNGTGKIDAFSDSANYMDLITYAVAEPDIPCDERIEEILELSVRYSEDVDAMIPQLTLEQLNAITGILQFEGGIELTQLQLAPPGRRQTRHLGRIYRRNRKRIRHQQPTRRSAGSRKNQRHLH